MNFFLSVDILAHTLKYTWFFQWLFYSISIEGLISMGNSAFCWLTSFVPGMHIEHPQHILWTYLGYTQGTFAIIKYLVFFMRYPFDSLLKYSYYRWYVLKVLVRFTKIGSYTVKPHKFEAIGTAKNIQSRFSNYPSTTAKKKVAHRQNILLRERVTFIRLTIPLLKRTPHTEMAQAGMARSQPIAGMEQEWSRRRRRTDAMLLGLEGASMPALMPLLWPRPDWMRRWRALCRHSRIRD